MVLFPIDARARTCYYICMDARTRATLQASPPRTCAGRPHSRPSSALLLVHANQAQGLGIGDSDCWLCWPCYAAAMGVHVEPIVELVASEPTSADEVGKWHTDTMELEAVVA